MQARRRKTTRVDRGAILSIAPISSMECTLACVPMEVTASRHVPILSKSNTSAVAVEGAILEMGMHRIAGHCRAHESRTAS